jgi:hypothetical protein
VIAAVLITAAALAPSGTGVGIGTEYACLPVTAQPGHSYPLGDVSVEDTGSGGESVSLTVTPVTAGPVGHLAQVPPSWVTFGSSPASLGAGQSASVPVTLAIPAGAAPGPYESSILAYTGGTPASGPGGQVTFGAGATTRIVFTVGPSPVPPPPCDALDLAQSTGQFPPWPTRAFATTSWAQVFARERTAPSGPPTASAVPPPAPAAAPPAVAAAAHHVPKKVPANWPGWLVIIVGGLILPRWFLKWLGVGR